MSQNLKRRLSIARDDPFRDIFMRRVSKHEGRSRQLSQQISGRGKHDRIDSDRSSPARLEGQGEPVFKYSERSKTFVGGFRGLKKQKTVAFDSVDSF